MRPEVDEIHTPSKEEVMQICKEHDDAYDRAISNSIDISFGQRQILNEPIQEIALSLLELQLPEFDFKKDESVFIKDDSEKPMLSLIEPHFISSLGDVLTMGAKKYAKNNWQKCEDTSRYKDALLRHIYAYLSGEQIDQESGLEHLAHCACNIMFLQHFDNKKEQS